MWKYECMLPYRSKCTFDKRCDEEAKLIPACSYLICLLGFPGWSTHGRDSYFKRYKCYIDFYMWKYVCCCCIDENSHSVKRYDKETKLIPTNG